MKKKPDLSKCKIEYCGQRYDIDLYGAEDSKARGGLFDLAGKCADVICNQLDDAGYFPCAAEDLEQAHETVQDEIYRLIKFYMLRPLNQQIANQSGSAM
jgi:hypothetical protein